MRKFLFTAVAVLAMLVAGTRKCSAQMVVSDPAALLQMIAEYCLNEDLGKFDGIATAESLKKLYDDTMAKLDELSDAVEMLSDVSSMYSSLRNVVDMSEDLVNNQRDFTDMVQYFHTNGTYSEYRRASAYLSCYSSIFRSIYHSYERNISNFKRMESPSAMDYVNFVRELTTDMERTLYFLTSMVKEKFLDMYYTSIVNDMHDKNVKSLEMFFY